MTRKEFQAWATRFPEALMLVSADGVILAANSALVALFRLPVKAIIDKTLFEFAASSAASVRQSLEMWSRSGQMVYGSAGFEIQGGDQLRCEGAVVRPASAEAPAVLVVRARQHATVVKKFLLLNRKAEELAHLNAQLNEFLGIAAHDLRNSIGVVKMASRLLADNISAEERESLIASLAETSDYMERVLENFLGASAIESGNLTLHCSETDLTQLTHDVVRVEAMLAERYGISISFSPLASLPKVWADESKVKQVLHNLIGNAVKFSPRGESVEVRVEAVDQQVCVSVEDRGSGIAEEDRSKLFQAFSRGKNALAKDGMGLGLRIVRRIVQEHGGGVDCQSVEGHGTIFSFWLPARRSEQSRGPDPLLTVDLLGVESSNAASGGGRSLGRNGDL